MKTILRIVVAVAALLLAASPQGASLRPEKATDPSVCDLGPNTTPVLSRRMLNGPTGHSWFYSELVSSLPKDAPG